MGEIGIEFEKVLKFLFAKLTIGLWNSLAPEARHSLTMVAIIASACALVFWITYKYNSIRQNFVLFFANTASSAQQSKNRWQTKAQSATAVLYEKTKPPNIPPESSILLIATVFLLALAGFGSWSYNFYLAGRLIAFICFLWLTKHFYQKNFNHWAFLAGALLSSLIQCLDLDLENLSGSYSI